jgi:uncharacterized protein YfaT (DUF1175 family)
MGLRGRTGWVALAVLLTACEHAPLPPPRVVLQPPRIFADGYDVAKIAVEGSTDALRVSIVGNARGARVEENGIRAGVLPGKIELKVEVAGHLPATAELELALAASDRASDGTPDFMRLDEERDRQAFRRWFTYLAEAQYFQESGARPAEIDDCAALIRYAYREALHVHDSAWTASAKLPIVPALDSVAKYQYPFTPLGAALFRAQSGPFQPGDLETNAFLQFADAQTLRRYNTHFVSRDVARAQPGDLIFFRQDAGHTTFHSMIYLGASQLRPDRRKYFLYHTGPDGSNPGEMRRLTVDELMHFPQPEWRPLASNPSFLGVSRWNILWRQDA